MDRLRVISLLLILAVCGCAEQTMEDVVHTGNAEDIVSMETMAIARNWDADAEEDGLVVDISFYDRDHDLVLFKDQDFNVVIRIFTIVLDDNWNEKKGRLVYDRTFSMTTTAQIDDFFGTGIEIPFEELQIQTGDDQYGTMEVTVIIPGVGTFEGVAQYVQLYP